jgi:hypothetical protein
MRGVMAAILAAVMIGVVHAGEPPDGDVQPAERVTITAQYDRYTLEHTIVPRFVAAHTMPTRSIGQIARWQGRLIGRVCPSVTGLQQPFSEFVTGRIQAIARSIGAPMAPPGERCGVNIEVVVTSTPQALLDDVARRHAWELGSNRTAHDTEFTRVVQSWYTTGTRAHDPGSLAPPRNRPGVVGEAGLAADQPWDNVVPLHGTAGSHLGMALSSELLHVLVIADAQQLRDVPVAALADYLAMVTLSQAPLPDVCNQLPSILDLLSTGCGDRPPPAALTAADAAFLKALYAATLDKNFNIEQAEVDRRMVDDLLSER